MKKKLILKQDEERIYIRHIDYRVLKPLLEISHIEVHKTDVGKYTGKPQYYISIADGFKLLETARQDYIITFI